MFPELGMYPILSRSCSFADFQYSAAAPTFAGLVYMLNSFRLEKGKPALGFLNPLLYSNPHVLNDITAGASDGCQDSEGPAANAEWEAVPGWDPVTGLGTANFGKLKDLVLS